LDLGEDLGQTAITELMSYTGEADDLNCLSVVARVSLMFNRRFCLAAFVRAQNLQAKENRRYRQTVKTRRPN